MKKEKMKKEKTIYTFEERKPIWEDWVKKGASVFGSDVTHSKVVGYNWKKADMELNEEDLKDLKDLEKSGIVRNLREAN